MYLCVCIITKTQTRGPSGRRGIFDLVVLIAPGEKYRLRDEDQTVFPHRSFSFSSFSSSLPSFPPLSLQSPSVAGDTYNLYIHTRALHTIIHGRPAKMHPKRARPSLIVRGR